MTGPTGPRGSHGGLGGPTGPTGPAYSGRHWSEGYGKSRPERLVDWWSFWRSYVMDGLIVVVAVLLILLVIVDLVERL